MCLPSLCFFDFFLHHNTFLFISTHTYKNCEASIKNLLVDALGRHSFRTAPPLFEYLTGQQVNGMPVALPVHVIVKSFKDRSGVDDEVRLATHDKFELMCALTTIITPGGIKASVNNSVIYVGYTKARMRNLTDNPNLLRNATRS